MLRRDAGNRESSPLQPLVTLLKVLLARRAN
jgi:hypothetical protein